jgi:hypothetical protein
MAAFSQSPCDGSLLSHAILSAWDTLSSLLAGLFPITLQSCHFFKNLSLTSLARWHGSPLHITTVMLGLFA